MVNAVKGVGIGSSRFFLIRFPSKADVWTISNFNSLPRKGFRPRFFEGWYSIIPQAQFTKILSTSEFTGGIYER